MPLFKNFFKNIVAVFHGRNLLWLSVACILTALSVYSGFDWIYFTALKGTLVYNIFFPAVVIGGFVPIFIPVLLMLTGWFKKDHRTMTIGLALGQAAILGSLISSSLKAFTGRIPPPMELVQGFVDNSRGFQFGFWEGGIFWGWPSSHTTIAFAMAVALVVMYPRNKTIRTAALAYAFYIGIGISMSIHWFSEFIAGVIVGTVIGVVVGRSFARKAHR